MTLPTLYSFRRCPYAMRARLAILLSGKKVCLREIILRDKPEEMLAASPKGTVPVLIEQDGTVVDESLDVMFWALRDADPSGVLPTGDALDAARALIARNDGPFKHHLDRYKYATRYEDADGAEHREAGAEILADYERRLTDAPQLSGEAAGFADYAIFPFVRQFRIAGSDWFDAQNWPNLQRWLAGHMESDLFATAMQKFPLWKETGEEVVFGERP